MGLECNGMHSMPLGRETRAHGYQPTEGEHVFPRVEGE